MVRLRNGLGWIDIAGGRCAMPPDGERFAVAPGHSTDWRIFYVAEIPEPVAVISWNAGAPLGGSERAQIEAILSGHVAHVAFLRPEGASSGSVTGHGPPLVLATAAATLVVLGTLDDLDSCVLTVDAKTIEVRLQFCDGRWEAAAVESPGRERAARLQTPNPPHAS
jgi:hypothetical protein